MTLHLEEWEMLCNECGGCGDDPSSNTFTTICPKCQGAGKVDWLENILGKNPHIRLRATFLDDSSYMINDKILAEIAKEMADQIDKEILESILTTVEQTNKIMKISKTIMCEMEDKS